MEITYVQVLIGVCVLLFGILAGFQIFKFFSKKDLNEDQTQIVLLVQNYASKCYEDLKTQFNGKDELREKIVQMIVTEFPGVDKKIAEISINFILDQAEGLLNNDNKIN